MQNNNIEQFKVNPGEHLEEIQIERNLLRFITHNIMNDISKKYGVQVYITDKSSTLNNLDTRRVALIGKDQEAIEKAKEEINFKREQIGIEHDLIEYICGSNDSNLRFFEQKSKVISVTIESRDKVKYLEVIGNQSSIEEFKSLINTHIDYKEHFL